MKQADKADIAKFLLLCHHDPQKLTKKSEDKSSCECGLGINKRNAPVKSKFQLHSSKLLSAVFGAFEVRCVFSTLLELYKRIQILQNFLLCVSVVSVHCLCDY